MASIGASLCFATTESGRSCTWSQYAGWYRTGPRSEAGRATGRAFVDPVSNVAEGDTLSELATRFNTTEERLLALGANIRRVNQDEVPVEL